MSETYPSRAEAKKHFEWRKSVAAGLPDLAARVFALRQGGYSGCGFHWDMERTLGKVIAIVNDYNNKLTLTDTAIDQVIYDGLLEQVAKAEWSKAHRGASPEGPDAPWFVPTIEKIENQFRLFELIASSTSQGAADIFDEVDELTAQGDQDDLKTMISEALVSFKSLIVKMALGAHYDPEPENLAQVDKLYWELEADRKTTALLCFVHGLDSVVDHVKERVAASSPTP